jgi:hypothetical protein
MNSCRKCRRFFPEALYQELAEDKRRRFEEHLKDCPSCAAEFEKMKSTLRIMAQRVRREPGQEFWGGYWTRLASKLQEEEQRRRRTSPLVLLPKWTYQAAAAVVLIVLGIFLGRVFFTSPGPKTQLVAGKEAENMLRAENYFERSKVVLLAMVNFDPKAKDPYGLNFPEQKRVSRELVREAGYLKTQFSEPSQKRMRELVTDLEVILLQIANLEQQQGLAAVELVKQGVDERGILFKINLSEIWRDAQKNKEAKGASKSRDKYQKSRI